MPRRKELTDTPARWRRIKKLYGLTKEDYNQILEDQGGVCFICQRSPYQIRPRRHLAVEHCHATGRIRGAVCYFCNHTLIPFFEKHPERAKRIHKYLTRKVTYGTVPS